MLHQRQTRNHQSNTMAAPILGKPADEGAPQPSSAPGPPAQLGVLHHLVIPCGFLAPAVLSAVDAVCQHADCTSATPTSVGAALAACLPHGCPYRSRVVNGKRTIFDAPGTVERMQPEPGSARPVVFNLFTMLRAAAPDASRQYAGVADTAVQRVAWFEACLDELSPFITDGMRVAFPYRIGCGQGDWAPYR